MFSKYYQSELSYLRDLGREFAQNNPSLSSLFAESGGDPDVERLLEGFAFLTARIRERIDDSVPEVIEALCQMLVPQYVRCIPACSIVEFTPQHNALRGRHPLRAGTELGSRAIDGTSSFFRTSWDIDLLPLALENIRLDHSVEEEPEIRISFKSGEAGRFAIFQEKGIDIFLHGPLGVTSSLFLWFMRHLKDVTYKNGDIVKSLGPSVLEPTGLMNYMMPWPQLSPGGIRLALEYFTLPEKLLFFKVKGLDQLNPELGSDRFELHFRFHRPPKLPERIDRDMFRLHSVPVVNLFDTTADPIPLDARVHEYLLRPAGMHPLHGQVYSVNGVTGLRGNRGGRIMYTPYFDFTHTERPPSEQTYYTTRRAQSPIDHGLDVYLSVLTPRDVAPRFDDETLSIDLTCTNRHLPSELRAGDIAHPTPRSPTIAKFRNLTKVTKPTYPPLGRELHWRLVSHLAVNHRSFSDPKVLRTLLSLYNFFEEADKQVGLANRLRVEAVRKIEMVPATRLMEQVPVRGAQSTIEIEETSFASEGDAFLFGCAVDSLFGHQTPINAFHQTTLTLHPSTAEIRWPARNGRIPIF